MLGDEPLSNIGPLHLAPMVRSAVTSTMNLFHATWPRVVPSLASVPRDTASDWSGTPRIETVDEEGGPSYPVITGSYDSSFRWESRPIAAGTPLAVPSPLFKKLDQSVVDEEIARLQGDE